LTGKDERHDYQKSVISMVSEALVGIDAALIQAVKDADAIVTGADALKHERDAALVTANSTVTALEAALVEKKKQIGHRQTLNGCRSGRVERGRDSPNAG